MSSRELEQWLDPAGPGNPHQLPVGEETSLPRARGLPTALNTSLSQQSARCKSAGRQSTCLPPRDFRPEPDSYREAGAQQTPPSSPERGRGGREDEGVPGARGCPGRTERRLSAPGCLWALALRTSPLADRAEVPLDRYIFPHLHPANSFRSDLHCAQPPLLSPSRNHHQTPPPFAVYPPLPALAQTSPAWTSAVTPTWPSASAPQVSSTGGQRIYLNVV